MSLAEKKIKQWISDPQQCQNVLIVQTDLQGYVKELVGDLPLYFTNSLAIGMKITDEVIVLEGLFPFQKQELFLPNIEIQKQLWVHIDLVKERDVVWIAFSNTTAEAEKMRGIIQQRNEAQLKTKSDQQMKKDDPIFKDLIKQLNVAVFELDKNLKCRLSGEIPSWFSDLKPKVDKENNFELEVLFPLLETFLPEFESIKTIENQKIYSDLWTEVNSRGEELILRAIGLRAEGSNWVLIMLYDSFLFHDRELLQKARELELHTESITKAKNELERLIRFKDQFISIVSHDLRSPISSVISATDIMLADQDFKKNMNPDYLELLENINKDMNLLITYNQKLYHWSNLQLGNLSIEPQRINVSKLFKAIKLRFSKQAKEKDIKILVDLDASFHINADESLFNQALNNLIGNAIKFTPPKGEIVIKARNKATQITISIIDNGVGMISEISDNLFKGYVKGHTSGTNGEKGSGLGLGICKRIMDAHGFEIGVKSTLHKGTEFLIKIY